MLREILEKLNEKVEVKSMEDEIFIEDIKLQGKSVELYISDPEEEDELVIVINPTDKLDGKIESLLKKNGFVWEKNYEGWYRYNIESVKLANKILKNIGL